jgi:Mn2+/Fe2+ NRAMP family transporter
LMGPLRNMRLTTSVAWGLAVLITGLNVFLIYGFVAG